MTECFEGINMDEQAKKSGWFFWTVLGETLAAVRGLVIFLHDDIEEATGMTFQLQN